MPRVPYSPGLKSLCVGSLQKKLADSSANKYKCGNSYEIFTSPKDLTVILAWQVFLLVFGFHNAVNDFGCGGEVGETGVGLRKLTSTVRGPVLGDSYVTFTVILTTPRGRDYHSSFLIKKLKLRS